MAKLRKNARERVDPGILALADALRRKFVWVDNPVSNGEWTALSRLMTEAGFPATVQSVAKWPRVPAGRCRLINRLTGVPLHVLRPDIYDPPSKQKAA